MNSNDYLFGLRPVIYVKAFRRWITLPSSRRIWRNACFVCQSHCHTL